MADNIVTELKRVGHLVSRNRQNEAMTLFRELEKNYSGRLAGLPEYHFTKARILAAYQEDFRAAIREYETAEALFTRAASWREVAVTQGNLAGMYVELSQYEKARTYKLRSMNYFSQHPNSADYADAASGLARIYLNTGDYLKAADLYLINLRFYEKTDSTFLTGKAYAQVGLAYDYAELPEKAVYYYQKAVEFRRQAKDTLGLINTYNNLGIVHKNQHKYADADQYYQEAYALAEMIGDDRHKINPLINLGVISRIRGQYTEAIRYYKNALQICTGLNREKQLYTIYNNLAFLYNTIGQPVNALPLSDKAAAFAVDKGTLEDKAEYLHNHAVSLYGMKRYPEAYAMLMESKRYTDSLYRTENSRKMAELSTTYETEKKEQQIGLLNQQTTIERLQLRQRGILLVAALVVILTGSAAAYFMFQQRRLKASARLQHEINRQQKEAANAVLNAEERERRRIAVELHDGVGQILSTALLHASQISKQIQKGVPPDVKSVDNVLHLLTDSYDEMRSISHQMMPNALLKTGLAAAIREFIQKIEHPDMQVNLDIAGMGERLNEQTETVLYRITQESVNNVVKHAAATKLTIQLFRDQEGITLTIEDNGRGFDLSSLTEVAGIGLKNMRSRIDMLKGSMEIDTSPGRGTLISIFVPATTDS